MDNTRASHTASVLQNGKVLVAGGNNNFGYLYGTELYDPSLGTWAATGNMIGARTLHTASVPMNGKVLVTGGDNGGFPINNTELYDPLNGT